MQVKAAYATLGVAGRVAVVAGTLGAAILGVSLFTFGRSVVGPGITTTAGPGDAKDLAQLHDAAFANYMAQWDGRSVMIIPGAPPAPIKEPDPIAQDTGPKTPVVPSSYDGPAIIAMVMDTVWFSDGLKLSVGDEAKEDVEVVEVLAPWEAILKWKGKEFTVPLFARDKLVVKPEEKKPAELSPGDAKPDEPTTASTPDHPKVDVSKVDPGSLVVVKPAPKPAEKPKDQKPDAAPGAAPATAPPPGEPGPETEASDSSKPPSGGDGGRS
jgi:hypothetical protein